MDEYIGAIQTFGFSFPPKGWAFCDGTLMSISSNEILYSLIGTAFGGDGVTTFALPDLRGRSIVHVGEGPGLSPIQLGQKGGNEELTLMQANLPAHNHALTNNNVQISTRTSISTGSGNGINEPDNGNYPFGSGGSFPGIYCEQPAGDDKVGGVTSTSFVAGSTGITGSNIPVSVRDPYVAVYTSICIVGIYPPRD